jgi:hypothetical protein
MTIADLKLTYSEIMLLARADSGTIVSNIIPISAIDALPSLHFLYGNQAGTYISRCNYSSDSATTLTLGIQTGGIGAQTTTVLAR